MGIINTYIVYHATDRSNIQNIIDNNFEYKANDEHWLGNGIYFFKDYALAKQWGEKIPTSKYGEINNYVLIKAKIVVDDDFVCDMTFLDGYNYVKETFELYWKTVCETVDGMVNYSYQKLRCAYFDWLIKEDSIKCLIANFTERNNLSIKIDKISYQKFDSFHIPYVEIQYCVTDPDCIVERTQFIC